MPLTPEQFQFVQDLFIPRSFERNELLMREGEIPKYGAFVCKGCLRSYVVDKKGKEHVLQFAPENWWLADIDNLVHKKPTGVFIDAIEHSDVLLIDVLSFQKLLEQLPGLSKSFQAGQQRHTAAKDKRIIASLSATAEERYQQFLDSYPSIALRVPLHMLASYLGVAPETLSRIRKKWSGTNKQINS